MNTALNLAIEEAANELRAYLAMSPLGNIHRSDRNKQYSKKLSIAGFMGESNSVIKGHLFHRDIGDVLYELTFLDDGEIDLLIDEAGDFTIEDAILAVKEELVRLQRRSRALLKLKARPKDEQKFNGKNLKGFYLCSIRPEGKYLENLKEAVEIGFMPKNFYQSCLELRISARKYNLD
jgi:hypothetical protein